MKMLIRFFVLLVLLLSSFGLFASEATDEMLDDNSCHTCKRACSKFGLKNGKFHCHAIKKGEYELPMKFIESDFPHRSLFLLKQFDYWMRYYVRSYISIDPETNKLIVVPSKKDPSGQYKFRERVRKVPGLDKHDCPFEKVIIVAKGAPKDMTKAFGAEIQPDLGGVYTVTIDGKEYLGIAIKYNLLAVVDKESNVKCAGEIKKDRLELQCLSGEPVKIINRSTPCCLLDYTKASN